MITILAAIAGWAFVMLIMCMYAIRELEKRVALLERK